MEFAFLDELHTIVDSENWLELKMKDPLAFHTINQRVLKAMNRILKNEHLTKKLPVDIVDRIIQPQIQHKVNMARPPKSNIGDLESFLLESKVTDEDELIKMLQTLTQHASE